MTTPDDFHFEIPFGDDLLDTYDRPILDTYDRQIQDAGSWQDIQADVLTTSPIVIFQGQRNGESTDRVADPGTIKFVLDNSAFNSAGLLGYYSPDHTNLRAKFYIGQKVRVGVTWNGDVEWFSEGRIVQINPDPGLLDNKRVNVTVGDWLELASRTPMPRIPVQESVTDDQILQTIVTALGTDGPRETDLETGAYTYEYALTDVEDEVTPIMSVLQRIAQSGVARIFITGGATSGETLRYVDLYSLLAYGEPVAVFNNAFMESDASRRARHRVKRVIATSYPMQAVADEAIYSLPAEIAISAGETIELIGWFRDPNTSSSLSIPAVNVDTPAADTGYKLSSVSGSGNDLNGSFQIVSFDVGARSFKASLKNTSGVTGYLWQFNVNGDALYSYSSQPVKVEDTSIAENDATSLNYDLPYHSEYALTKEIATAMLSWYSPVVTVMPFIEFTPSLSDVDFDKLIACKPGELISVVEDVTGIAYSMIVMGREIRIHNGGAYITERLYIAPAQQVESGLFFTLDTLGQDDLDGTNTILAFGG